MQKLHLVGFTTDHEGLILSARRGARSGSFVLAIDAKLEEAVDDLRARRTEEPEGDRPAEAPRRPRVESALSVKEIQARLRTGRSIAEVARAAGVDVEWVDRFAPPVLAERAQVITKVQSVPLRRARLGPSALPIGEAVRHNLADRGVSLTGDEFASAWTARQVADGRWAVRFTFHFRGRDQVLRFDLDDGTGEVSTSDRASGQLGYVAPRTTPTVTSAERPRPSKPDPRPVAKRAVVSTGFRPERVGKPVSRPAKEREKAAVALSKAAAKRAAEAERGAARKAREKREAAARREREEKAAAAQAARDARAAQQAAETTARAKAAAAKEAAANRKAAAEKQQQKKQEKKAAGKVAGTRKRAPAASGAATASTPRQASKKPRAKGSAAPAKPPSARKASSTRARTAVKERSSKGATRATTPAAKTGARTTRSGAGTKAAPMAVPAPATKAVPVAKPVSVAKEVPAASEALVTTTDSTTNASGTPSRSPAIPDRWARPGDRAPRAEAALAPLAVAPPDGPDSEGARLTGAAANVYGTESARALFRRGLVEQVSSGDIPAVADGDGASTEPRPNGDNAARRAARAPERPRRLRPLRAT